MRAVLEKIPLLGAVPEAVVGGIALLLLVLAVVVWRGHKVWRALFVLGFFLFAILTVGAFVNTKFAYFDTAADLAGIPNYTVDSGAKVDPTVPQPNGIVFAMKVPDTRSRFGNFDANVWLPPQYFTDKRAHFPVIYLAHGNPGFNDTFLGPIKAADAALKTAQAGKPVILVMPQVLQSVTGDSLCVDTQAQGNAETYITQDVIAAADSQLRTITNAGGRTIGGNSMGGFCALNLGLKHPDLYSAVIDLSGETISNPDGIDGGNQALYGGSDWQKRADANSPEKYVSTLDSSKGPALWLDVGTSDGNLPKIQRLASQLKSKGFTVELHTRPGGHDFTVWTNGFAEALPWAAQQMKR